MITKTVFRESRNMLNCQEVSGWNYPSSDLSNMTAVVITAANKTSFSYIHNRFMISGTTSILKSFFQTCAAIYQLLLRMAFTSRN